MLAVSSVMLSECPRVYVLCFKWPVGTCFYIWPTCHGIACVFHWNFNTVKKSMSQWTMWHWKSFSICTLISSKQLVHECSIFVCIHMTVAEYSVATDINKRKTVQWNSRGEIWSSVIQLVYVCTGSFYLHLPLGTVGIVFPCHMLL